jgi:hypothetical protein
MVEDVVDFVFSCFQDDCLMWRTDEKVLWLKGLGVKKGERADVKTTTEAVAVAVVVIFTSRRREKSLPGAAM